MMTRFAAFLLVAMFAMTGPASAMISLVNLAPGKARELGITMKERPNGDAGVLVWLEFRKEGKLEHFAHAELRMEDADGEHLLSARLAPRRVRQGQSEDVVGVAFSVDPSRLGSCSFRVVAYEGREGTGYILKATDFLDLPEE